MDWAYIKDQRSLLVIVDAGSGWVEAFICRDRSTTTVLEVLRKLFCRYGVPQTLVTDNGAEFKAETIQKWLAAQACRQLWSPLYHPRANG